MRLLNKEEVLQCLPMPDAIAATELAFAAYHNNKAVVPQRIVINTTYGATLFMPSLILNKSEKQEENGASSNSMGIKIVSVRPNNFKTNLPNVCGCIIMLDEETGLPNAMLDASEVTGIRTAASSAVATKYFANTKTAKTLAVFGSGLQAKYHIIAMACVLPQLEKVKLWNRTKENALQLIQELTTNSMYFKDLDFTFVSAETATSAIKRAIHVEYVEDKKQIVTSSQVICTVTNASEPVFDGSWLQPGTHVNCVGSYKPTMQEVDETTILKSKCVGDIKDHVWEEAGDFLIPEQKGLITRNHILTDLGEYLTSAAGERVAVRQSEQDITLFKSVGVALQDTAAGEVVVKNAEKKNIGTVWNM